MSEDKEHECFVELSKKWSGPIEQPISFNRETGALSTDTWMLKVFNYTSTGNVSKRGGGWLRLAFCPICGERLTEVQT